MSSDTIVPASQIAALQTGLDSVLKPIAAALQATAYAESLPLVGPLATSAASHGEAALQQIGSLETRIFNALNAINNAPQTVAEIQGVINNALTLTGFAPNGVVVDSVGGELTFTLNDSASNTFSTALSSNFGLPGLDFQTSGAAQAQLNYALDVTGSVDTSGVFGDSAPTGTALAASVDVTAPNFAASGTLGSGNDTLLGDLRFGAVDNGSSLAGSFSLDINGGVTFTGDAGLNVILTSDMGTAALPSISADLVGNWAYPSSGGTPTIALDNVTYKLGTFIDNFLDPVIQDVNAVLQSTPVKDALAIFETPLDFLGGGTVGNGGLLGGLWKNLDVGGTIDPATGQDTHDGQITLVDFLQLAQNAGAPIDVTPLVQFLDDVQQVQQWVGALANSGTDFGSTTYSLGSFTIPGDVRDAAQQISQATPSQNAGAGQPQDLSALLASLTGTGVSSGPGQPTPGQALQTLLTSPVFSFPIITNPIEAVQFLLGGTVDLFDATLPPATISAGSISATGVPVSTIPLISVPIPTSIPFITLDLALSAAFQGSVALDFGYDTTGLTDFANSHFTQPADLLNGLFVQAETLGGTVLPVVQLAGAVQLGATLAAGDVASVSASGNVGGVLDLTFSQAGKNYINTLANELQTNPFGIFDASGRITAGFEAVARAIFLAPWVYDSPRITLAQFDTAAGAANTLSGPTATTWIGGASGDFETPANWNPAFALIGGVDDYGNSTIGTGSTVTFQGTVAADLTSLTLAASSVLSLAHGQFTIENSTTTSANSGDIFVRGGAQLVLQASFNNIGMIAIEGGTAVVSGLLDLTGGGSVALPDDTGTHLVGADANALLWNENNTISGGGTIAVSLVNAGTVEANGTNVLVLSGQDSNSGLLEAVGNGTGAGTTRTGGLEIVNSLANAGGTIAAASNGQVVLDNGVTITGGTLRTGAFADGSVILTDGEVTLDGGTVGLSVAGIVVPGSGSTLTLTGVINSAPFSTNEGKYAVVSDNGTVLLQGATFHNGFFNALAPASGPAGTIEVSGTATLDGSAGNGVLAIDGQLEVGAGDTLVVDGTISPGLEGGAIGLDGGTLVIGDAISDAAVLGPALPGSVTDTGGALFLAIGRANVIVGADAGSSLTNNWLIQGSGQLGGGQLAIINTASGTIAAVGGVLAIDGGGPVLNAGLMEAALGTLNLQSNVANAGGTIQSLALDAITLDGATIAGGELAGGGLFLGSLGAFVVNGHAMLDGTASPLTLADAADVLVQSGDTLTLAGSIVNQADLGVSTIAVQGNASLGGVADLQVSGTVTLSGGGAVVLSDASGAGVSSTQIVTGVAGDTLLNVDNAISGYGSVGVGDNTLTLVNEAAGVVDANIAGNVLVLNTGTNVVVNNGLLEATSGGTLDLHGSIANAGATLLAAGGTVLLDNATLVGGVIATSAGGSVRAAGSATLDGRGNAITVNAGADVAVDDGNTLTALGTIVNDGTMQATGGTLVMSTGATAVTNLGRLAADGGTLDLQSNVANAGGTIAVTSGDVLLDGMTVTNGLLAGESPDTGFIDVTNTATLVGSAAVANGVTAAPANGLLNTADLRVQGGDTLTLIGTITNRSVINVIGEAGASQTATLRTAGTVVLTGGGSVNLWNASGPVAIGYEQVTGGAAGGTLDNLDNTISGYGSLGLGDGAFALINEAGGTVDAVTSTLVVNTGGNTIVNKGLMDATSGILDVHGTVANSGTISADGGQTELDSATVDGGTLASSAGGGIYAVGSSTLNGLASPVTLTPGARVVTGGGSVLVLEGSIVNHGGISLIGDSVNTLTATMRIAGTVDLSGGGGLSLFSEGGGPSSVPQVITGGAATDTLDNIANTIGGYGQLGAGKLTLRNEAGSEIEASGGALVVNTGANAVINDGLMAAAGGTLVVQSVVDSTGGGTLSARDLIHGGVPGIILLDGGRLLGGTVGTDLTDTASILTVSTRGGTLDGNAGAVTLAIGAQAVVDAGSTLTVTGSLANHGTISVIGESYDNIVATLQVLGTTTLSGGGTLALSSLYGGPSSVDQVITGATAAAKLENVDNTITGYGAFGAGQLVLANDAAGTIEAVGGALVLNTGTNAIVNVGLMQGFGGTLVVQGVVDSTSGGVVATLNDAGVSGIVQLDGGTLRGGTLRTDPSDPTSQIQITGKGGTLDGTAGTLTVTSSSLVVVEPGSTLTVEGAIANHGTMQVAGNGYYYVTGEMLVLGTLALSGGGVLSLADASGAGTENVLTQIVTGASAAATVDNIDNLIGGVGELGNGQLTLVNETRGTIQANGGTLLVDTAGNVISNKGLMEAVGGTLVLRGTTNNTSLGTIAALDSPGTVAGVVLLDGATLQGGTIVTDTHDPASMLTLTTTNGGTLDGIANAVTIAAGAQVVVGAAETLTAQGNIVDIGTLSVLGNGYYAEVAAVRLSNNVTLTGGGRLVLRDVSGATTATSSQAITGAAPGDTLDNVADTIIGYGSLGAGSMTLVNAAAGTIEANGGLLDVNTGANSATNQGLMEAISGVLQIDSPVANTALIVAGTAGGVIINGTVANSGTVAAASGGLVTLHGAIDGAASKVNVAAGGTLSLDGGSLNLGTLSVAATGNAVVPQNDATLTSVAVVNAGTLTITGNGYYAENATLTVAGTTTLSGGGTVVLADDSGATTASTSQAITGLAPGDTLDNVDNTIVGYGELGNGQLTLINAAKGTIEAAGATLVLNTGSVALANHGLLEAAGGLLVVQTVADNAGGGTVEATNAGTVSGIVELDGGTLRGGTIATSLTDPNSALVFTFNGGTLDGGAGGLTLAAGSHTTLAAAETLTLLGAVAEHGTLDVLGNGYYAEVAAVDVGGTLTLSGSGMLVLADVSGATAASTSQVVTGTAPGATLDNGGLVTGVGMLGDGALTLINEAAGSIVATGGRLVVDAGASADTNLGQMRADGGTLQLEHTLANQGTIAAAGGGTILVDGVVNNSGLVTAASGSSIMLLGSVINGATNAVKVAGNATMLLDGGLVQGGTLANAAGGTIDVTISGATLASVAFNNAGLTEITGNGYYAENATLTIAGTVTLSGHGTLALTDISGATTASTSQVITGLAPGDTLDNLDNTIIGSGELGNGQLTLINAAGGTIEANIGSMVVNTGATALVNHGLMEAVAGTLVVQSVVDDTGGGTIAAFSSNGVPGTILLDGGTLRGGVVATSGHGAALAITANGGTLDGTAGSVTLAAGSQAIVAAGETLTTLGSIAEDGRLKLQGNGYYGQIGQVDVAGTLSLGSGGSLQLSDASGAGTNAANTEVINGTAPGALLDNAGLIDGLGLLGDGPLGLTNEATGTIDAIGGALVLNAGTAVSNAGLMQALPGATLDVAGDLANTGMVLVNSGTVVVAGSVTGTGRIGLEGSELVLGGGVAAGQTIAFYNFGTTSTIDLSQPSAIGGTIVGFATNDTIIVEGTTLTSVDYTATAANLGTLALMSDTTIVGVVTLAGTYSAADFGVTNAADGSQSVVTSTADAGPAFSHAVASAATPDTVNFGTHHAGDTLSQALTIENTGPAGSSTEKLDAGFSDTTGAGRASGSITGLAAGGTDSSSLLVGLSTKQGDGTQSGTVVLAPNSDGTGVDGFGLTPLDPQTIAVSGVLYNFASASAAPVDFGNRHIGDTLSQNLSVTNSGTNDGFTENLNASLGGATGAATGSGGFTGLAPSLTDSTSLTIGVNANADGVRTGNVVLTPVSDGTTIDGLGTTLLTLETIAATGTIYNYASAGLASDTVSFGAHHVGDTLSQALPISNAAPADGFTEKLDASLGGATGDLTATGTVSFLPAGFLDFGDLRLGLANTTDGAHGGTAVLSLISDGLGIDGLGTTDLIAQTITATGTLFNYATASAATPGTVNFGAHHAGDTLSQTLSISNIGAADGFTEKLDASAGGATGAATANSSFNGLAAGQTDSASLKIGLSSADDGVIGGTATITLHSDGTGVDGLVSTPLTAQTIAVVGTLYNYATAGVASVVNLGKHHVGEVPSQALSITNLGTADGFTERLDVAIGGTTGAVTAIGSVASLAAGATDGLGLSLGLAGTNDGVQSGNVVLTLHSDGTGIDGLGSTPLTAETIAATGTLYNYATANAIGAVSFGNRHVGDALSHALSISNTGAADGFTDKLDATVGGATGVVVVAGTLVGLAAGGTDNSSLVLGLSSVADGAHGGSAVVSLVSDGAGVDGLGTQVLGAQTIAATGTLFNYATASAAVPGVVNFGAHHVGDALHQTLSISNIGTADGFTENLDASMFGVAGAATDSGAITGLAAGASNSGTLTVGLATTHDGVQSGTATLVLSSDGTGIDGLGTTVLTAQTIAATGTLYNLATAGAVGVLNLGAHHVGDAISHAVSISNIATVDSFTEELDASLGGASAGAFASGSINDLAAGFTNNLNLSVGLTSTTEGGHSGTATLTLASDGAFVDGLGKTALASQTLTVTATVYNYAAPVESATTLDFGAMRIGGATATRTLTISNGASADAFRENLGYALASAPAGFGLISASSGSVVAGAAGATVTFSAGAIAGSFNSTDTLTLTSLGAGTSGLANTALSTQQITLKAKEYATAVAKLYYTTINFGVEHFDDQVTIGDSISNIGTGALVDTLIGGAGTISSSQFISVGNLGTGVAVGPTSGVIGFQLQTNATGVFTATASLALKSHDADLADVAVAAGPITLIGTVENYATLALEEVSGGGTFSHVGNAYTLDLGTVAAGGSAPSVQLGALNAAAGLADALSGSFQISGSGAFINSGTAAFGGLGAGQADTAPSVSLSTGNTGTFTETITLTGTGGNASGYSGTLAPEVLTVIGTVVSSSRDLVWTGAAGTDFGTAANWDDTTLGLDPAITAPGTIDSVEFNGIGGGITGAGSVAALSFDGGGAWHVASGATVAAAGSLVVGSSTSAVLLIDGASRVIDGSGAQIAAQPGASGSSVQVTGAGSSFQIAGTLLVGNYGAGALNISAGGTVTASSLDAGVQNNGTAEGTAQISLTGAGSDLAISGDATLADAGSASMSILNGATFAAANLTIGSQGSASGALLVSDTGSVLDIAGTLNVGTPLGVGELTIGPNGTVIASKVVLNGEVVNEGGLLDPNEIDITANPIVGYGTEGGVGDIIVNDLSIEAKAGSKASQKVETVIGTVVGTYGTLSGTGYLVIDAGSTLDLQGGPVDSSQTVTFGANTGALVVEDIGGFTATIGSFQAGDTIFVHTAGTATFSQSGSVVDVISGGATLGVLDFASAGLAATAIGTGGALMDVPCFAAGTRIRTVRGEVRVEELREGDVAITAIDGSLAPVVWIGHREVDCARHPDPRSVWPVRIRAGAFGRGLPKRALTLSPDHAVYVNDVLVPVKHLVNGTTIAQVKVDRVTYYHVELDRHDVVYADGLPAESYLDVGDRANFANGGAVVRLHIDLAHHWEAGGCAPLVVWGEELEGVRAVVAARASVAAKRAPRANASAGS